MTFFINIYTCYIYLAGITPSTHSCTFFLSNSTYI